MTTLEELATAIGGSIRVTNGRVWLETTVGDLRAAVRYRETPLSASVICDLAVFTRNARELDPFYPTSLRGWDHQGALPRLRRGYIFVGCRGGVLLARSLTRPTIEDVVGVLWQLAAWARNPWGWRLTIVYTDRARHARFPRVRRVLSRACFALAFALLVALVRRIRTK